MTVRVPTEDNATEEAPTLWTISHRADRAVLPIADRHYNRQKIGSPQFVPPGRCIVLKMPQALWVTSWPFAEYVKHDWPGAWVNSCFRKERAGCASEMIRAAIAATRMFWAPPENGMVTMVDPRFVPGVMVRGERIFGFCYLKAGFKHVGFTKQAKQWVWQMMPDDMPPAAQPVGWQQTLSF